MDAAGLRHLDGARLGRLGLRAESDEGGGEGDASEVARRETATRWTSAEARSSASRASAASVASFLNTDASSLRISRWKARSAEEAGSETGSEACAAGDGDWDGDEVGDGMCEVAAKWSAAYARYLSASARAAPSTAKSSSTNRRPGGGDARTAGRGARGQAGRRRERPGEVDTRSRARGRSGARGRRLGGRRRRRERDPRPTRASARETRGNPLRLDVRVRLLPGGLAEQAKQLARVRHDDRRPARDPRRRYARQTVPRGDAGREASDVELRTLSSARAPWAQVDSSASSHGSRARRAARQPHIRRRDPCAMSAARRLTRALSRPFLSPVSPRGVSGDAARSVAAGRSTAVMRSAATRATVSRSSARRSPPRRRRPHGDAPLVPVRDGTRVRD